MVVVVLEVDLELEVVCMGMIEAVVPEVCAGGGTSLVRVEGVPVVPLFPAGTVVNCPWLAAVTVVFSVPSTRDNMMTVNTSSPDGGVD